MFGCILCRVTPPVVGIVDCVLCFFLSGYHVVRRTCTPDLWDKWFPCELGQSVTGPDVGKASKFEPTWILIFVPTSKPQQCAGVNESYISSWLGYFVWIRLSVLINYWTFRCISQWLHVFVFKSNTPYPCCLRRFSKKRSADMKAM